MAAVPASTTPRASARNAIDACGKNADSVNETVPPALTVGTRVATSPS